ncbi:MAG: endonuclease/exonuclease/phosphatase family protein [Spirochaetota bacterium]
MRFSVLTLNLHTWQEDDQLDKFDRIVRYVAEENITSLCLQACAQRRDAPLIHGSDSIRTDNAATIIRSKLQEQGLKYEMVWDFSHRSFGEYDEGSAILTQLPILGGCSRFVSAGDDPESVQSRMVVMTRLAVAPNSVIDLYSVHLSPPEHGLSDQIDSLLGFVEETPQILESMKPPPPRRRGAPRKRVVPEEPVVSTRLVCLAGDLNAEPDDVAKTFASRNYLEASSSARNGDSSTGTFIDGRWIDYVFIRPALRPQNARVVFSSEDAPRVSDHHAVAVEFEV